MNYFAAYYKEKFLGMKFIAFKKIKDHSKRVYDMIDDKIVVLKLQKYINNQLLLQKQHQKPT